MLKNNMEIECPTDPRLIFEAEFHEKQPASGESGYSLGSPELPPFYEITAVAWKNADGSIIDITDFVVNYASDRLPEWENELLD